MHFLKSIMLSFVLCSSLSASPPEKPPNVNGVPIVERELPRPVAVISGGGKTLAMIGGFEITFTDDLELIWAYFEGLISADELDYVLDEIDR